MAPYRTRHQPRTRCHALDGLAAEIQLLRAAYCPPPKHVHALFTEQNGAQPALPDEGTCALCGAENFVVVYETVWQKGAKRLAASA